MDLSSDLVAEVATATRKVLKDTLSPHIESSEHSGRFCIEAHRALGAAGLVAPLFPVEFGGADSMLVQLVVAEEMGYFNSGFGLSSLVSSCLFGGNVARHGTPVQKELYLPEIASGEKIGCWALTEPQIGSDAVSIKTTAQLKNSKYVINGTKTFITNGPIADHFIVITREVDSSGQPKGQGIDGGIAFILDRGMKGLSTGQPFKKMGHRSSPTGEIFLDNVEVGADKILGQPGKAFYDMKHSLDIERVIFSGLATGLMRFCIEATSKYVLNREQFGKSISEFQMIQDKIARMSALYESARIYLYYTLEKLENGENVNKEAAITKLLVAQNSKEVADHAVQCHGGYGYVEEYLVERCLRDSKLFEIGAGTSEVLRLIAAKQVLKEHRR